MLHGDWICTKRGYAVEPLRYTTKIVSLQGKDRGFATSTLVLQG